LVSAIPQLFHLLAPGMGPNPESFDLYSGQRRGSGCGSVILTLDS